VTRPIETPGIRANFLIKRRPEASREELIAHWFANHMPGVISLMAGTAQRYWATLFDDGDNLPWDGLAQIQMADEMAAPGEPFGTIPTDSFQEYAEPYTLWSTREYVVIDGAEHLPVRPLTLNDPFPTSRSGFFKVTSFLQAKDDVDLGAFFDHWLGVHAPIVDERMRRHGGFRYVIGHSLHPATAPYTGMAEMYFHSPEDWARYLSAVEPDGMENFIAGMVRQTSSTEFIGVP
jgi:hypothetical protein